MNKNYQVGIYLRLSREDERLGESGSITNQRAILLNYIKEHDLELIKEYVDDGVSGTTFDRDGFHEMIHDIEFHKINMVLTKDTSRLGRDHIEFGYYVEKYFPEHHVRYVAVCDNIDTVYSNNDMLLFKSAYNDMYVKDISNKIRASLNIKKRNGEFVGAYAPYGYQKDVLDKHKLVIEQSSAFIVKRIFQMFVGGCSVTKIADTLTQEKIPIPSVHKNMNRGLKSDLFGIWNQRTITDILTNPTYMGTLTQGRNKKINYKSKKRVHTQKEEWIMKENACPAIIEKNLFEMVQSIYQSNKNRRQGEMKTENDFLLKGLVYCKECGHTIGFRKILNKTGKIVKVYGNCNYYAKHRRQKVCTPHSIRYFELEQVILQNFHQLLKQVKIAWLRKSLEKNDPFQKQFVEKQKEIQYLEKEITFFPQKIDRLYEDRLNGIIDEERYQRMDKKIRLDICEKRERLRELQREETQIKKLDYEKLIMQVLFQLKPDRLLLTSFIDKIYISEDKQVEIFYKVKNETFEGISCNTFLK